ncbi:methylated-DNA--[protein]-cysteine S-methyltransferase [Brevibacterium aurantiacum]|uniref:Methylated-DNA--protein-cysteine methyltransferase n=3 Tax=Brevibacterium aurantiacum TaxID=273384 RepID=A0A2A3YUR1_BREAU|nr:Methylated-DNA--protein-cysteine methyltransferase [Brevibacterium aurantiacum]PCC43037.1 methylated-DNA--[protein]-cysteine S-methyltransferase [Brevibacterium aurantiacum]PCC51788.1 methylated-DNA--[protein]-cysteine S-methyltransferase [Brevibacterium aurantiacum]PCC54383.1 methylated-DNA--[protein]-cysteine S-methyltransferase [Brevibacterium aurantiacum]PCC56511.1 methylated-DNA--[protein]-cysteine S-methyltransferase [Brevibacterium aurantiacum]
MTMSSNEVDGPHPNADSAQATMATPVGPITVTGNGRSIVRVTWVESAEVDFSAAPPASAVSDPLLTEAMRQLHAYFNGSLTTFDLPLGLGQISAVARTVLTTLDETVESGTTVTYGELARRSGTGIPARAIGSIMGMNPLPLVIACHRVVASDGLGGYSGGRRGEGLATKRWLLEFEDALPRPLF